MKASKIKAIYLISSLLFFLFLLFLIGWIPRFTQKQELESKANQVDLPVVKIETIHFDQKPSILTLPSSAQAYHITPIWARTNGYLINFLHDIGDRVKEGDLLAEIDTPEIDQQYQQSLADLEVAKSKRDIAKVTAERWDALIKKNPEAVSTQEVDERKASLVAAESEVVSAEKNVDRLRDIQQFKRIYAPFDGIITRRDIDIGSLISAGSNGNPQELFQIAQINVIRFFVNVPQAFFRSIKNGLHAKVKIQEYPDKTFEGTVVRFANALDPISRTMLTEVDVENPNYEILPGLYADVTFYFPPSNKFVLPVEAIIVRTDGPQVATIDDQLIVYLHNVQLGRDFGSTIEVIDGLKENDKIVVNPTDRIRNGTKVKIIN